MDFLLSKVVTFKSNSIPKRMKLNFKTENPELITAVESFIEDWNSPSDSFSVKTSGSTGVPKVIQINKKCARASALTTCEYLDLKSNQNALLCLSPNTIAGKMMIIRSLVRNLNLIVVEPTSTPLDSLDEQLDFIAMVPMQMRQTINKNLEKLKRGQKIIIGGGPISTDLDREIRELPVLAYHTFGMSETISHVAMRNISAGDQFFEAVPNVSFESKDGELIIQAPHLGIGALKTNDAVELIDPQHFRWLGRTDFVINSGGVKLHPEEIEQQLSNLISQPFFISGVKDELLGEKVILCIESSPLNLEKSSFDEVLNKYQVPKSIYYFDSFIYTDSKKVNRLKTLSATPFYEKQVL